MIAETAIIGVYYVRNGSARRCQDGVALHRNVAWTKVGASIFLIQSFVNHGARVNHAARMVIIGCPRGHFVFAQLSFSAAPVAASCL